MTPEYKGVKLYLHPENAENNEERAADEYDVSDGSKGGQQGLHDQLQTRGATDHPETATKLIKLTSNCKKLLRMFRQHSEFIK